MELENEIFHRILKHLALKNPLAFKDKGLDQLKNLSACYTTTTS